MHRLLGVVAVLGAMSVACAKSNPAVADGGACGVAPTVRVVVPGQKVCQLTGDEDRALGQPTNNQSFSRFGLSNTDLGASFEHDGKLWFLFGDSSPSGAGTPNPHCGDAVAWSTDPGVAGCVSLDFVTGAPASFQSPAVPGIDLGCFNVPIHGVSNGSRMYVWFSTDCMSRSILSRSDDDAKTFQLVGTLSDCQCGPACGPKGPRSGCANPSCHFVNVSASILPEASAPADLPGSGDRVLLFGSGPYRKSNVYLAVTPLAQIENLSALSYFAGTDPSSCTPRWSGAEGDAVPLFDTANDNGNTEPCVGELSVHFDAALERWVALYNCNFTVDDVRIATSPWGPWSTAAAAFQPSSAYCKYIYLADAGCPQLADNPGNEGRSGDTYGPYAISRYSTKTAQGAQLYFTMSPGNPYSVMLMTAEIAATP